MSAPASAPPNVTITLPDGKAMTFARGVTGAEIAASIGPGLAKAALAVEVDGKTWDLFRPLERDAKLRIITRKDPEALELIRHDAAHVLAMAVQALYPGTQVTIGPAIEDGFYYDFARNEPFTPEDLPKIEAKMHEIVKAGLPTRREVWPRDKAIAHFEGIGEAYKAELIGDIPEGEDVSIYFHGEWHDLCRGSAFRDHRPDRRRLQADQDRRRLLARRLQQRQLQRIYGTAWRDKKELADYLDPPRGGREARPSQDRQGAGALHLLARRRRRPAPVDAQRHGDPPGAGIPGDPGGAQGRLSAAWPRRTSPRKRCIYRSRHLPYYKDDMYSPLDIDGENYYLRPMNCPLHHTIYGATRHSYRELPLRITEYGQDYRYEASGGLSGLMRVRGFCMNDAHIYCRHDQAKDEFVRVMHLHARYYDLMGIKDYYMRFSLPDLDKLDKYVDEPDKWLTAMNIIEDAMKESGYPYVKAKGEAAFYGPKVDFMIKSVIGTEYAISTNQLDFLATDTFDLKYIGEDGAEHPRLRHPSRAARHA